MKKYLLILAIVILTAGCTSGNVATNTNNKTSNSSSSPNHVSNFVSVKYRSDRVDVANPRFEYLDTSGSSLVRDAWYDADNQYMIIDLSGTKYHYCELPSSVWSRFKRASSFGTEYNSSIKGNYSCQTGYVPNY